MDRKKFLNMLGLSPLLAFFPKNFLDLGCKTEKDCKKSVQLYPDGFRRNASLRCSRLS